MFGICLLTECGLNFKFGNFFEQKKTNNKKIWKLLKELIDLPPSKACSTFCDKYYLSYFAIFTALTQDNHFPKFNKKNVTKNFLPFVTSCVVISAFTPPRVRANV